MPSIHCHMLVRLCICFTSFLVKLTKNEHKLFRLCVCVCACACARVRARAPVRLCVRVGVNACVCMYVCVTYNDNNLAVCMDLGCSCCVSKIIYY